MGFSFEFMPDITQMNECPDCASTNIVHGMMRDQVICRDCGLIFEELAPMLAVKESRFGKKVSKKKAAKPKKGLKSFIKKLVKKKK